MQWRIEKSEGGGVHFRCIVHFQKCSNFSITFFTLKISTIFFIYKAGEGQAQGPPNHAPVNMQLAAGTGFVNNLLSSGVVHVRVEEMQQRSYIVR